MSFVKSYITHRGLALMAKTETGGALIITRVLGGDGTRQPLEYHDMKELSNPLIQFELRDDLTYDSSTPNRLTLPVYYENSKLQQGFSMSEIGVFADDPDLGEILFAIVPSYENTLPLPGVSEGRLEITSDIIVELSLAPEVNIILPPSLVYLTKPEADARYWRIGVIYPATQIDETTGETTEVAQRRQDADIELLKKRADQGITTGRTVYVNTEYVTNWRILKGYYDQVRKLIVA